MPIIVTGVPLYVPVYVANPRELKWENILGLNLLFESDESSVEGLSKNVSAIVLALPRSPTVIILLATKRYKYYVDNLPSPRFVSR